jgi:hypothetical protein
MLTYSQVKGLAPHTRSTPTEVIKYLADRGIGLTLAAELGLKICRAEDLMSQARGAPLAYPDSRHAIVFPHHSPLGFEIDWWSARLVASAPAEQTPGPRLVHSFGEAVDPTVVPSFAGKMFCPPNTPPAAYLPVAESLPRWDALPKGARIFIHESALKAVNGAVCGTYSIGLNGVWGWSSRKHAIALLPELRDLPWKALELNPVILFDTNISTSTQVEQAAKRLAVKLLEVTGRTPRLLRMHKSPDILGGQDYGFDDYVHSVGREVATLFLTTPDEDLENIDMSEVELMKLELNDKVCIIRSLSRVADIESGALMTGNAFTELVYAHYQAEVETADGNLKPVNVAKLWLKDERRTAVDVLSYTPGQPRIHANTLNTWRGMGVDPAPGNVDQWLALLSNNAPTPDIAEWILDWLSFPLQNLGAKLNTLLLLFGPSGTGKDLFLTPMHAIYGGNSVKISNDELRSQFTSLYAARQFIHADELKRVQSAADAVNQKIKGIVTNKTTTVNRKGDPEYKIRNVSNLAITSNYYDCVKLDEDDRRAAVIRWSPALPELDFRGVQSYWKPLADWLESEVAAAAIHDYLLTRDISGFDPAAWAPGTAAKEEVIDAARNPLERFVAQLRADPQLHLPPLTDGRSLFSAKELTMYHLGTEPTKGQVDALSNEMRNQNFVRASEGKSIRSKSGVSRWWVVQRPDTPPQNWQDVHTCAQHLKAHNL